MSNKRGRGAVNTGRGWPLLALAVMVGAPATALASAPGAAECPYPVWSVIPFVGMLLSIALGPLLNAHWWEHNIGKVSFFWAMLFALPAVALIGAGETLYELLHITIIDYIPFLVLLEALFIIVGGIAIDGVLPHTPFSNTLLLLTGAVLASFVGTTGATILMIRPLIKANRERRNIVHTMIFLIFLVSNIGGALTPVGDPPLFIGYLHGVPFFWTTLHVIFPWLTSVAVLLTIYYFIDYYYYQRYLKDVASGVLPPPAVETGVPRGKIRISGVLNLLFLAGTLGAIVLSGMYATHPAFFDEAAKSAKGVTVMSLHGHALVMPYINIVRDGFILLMAVLSWVLTAQSVRVANNFTWGPMNEVAILFAGIFATIIPALKLLQARGGELGVTSPAQFFWTAGALSSFLDNTPTYLAFLSLAGQMGSQTGVMTDLGQVNERILMAISCGAVFMGANTYIGNAPNFMAKAIAEENGIKMPSFFGYMGWSVAILIPVFILVTFLFFR